MASYLRTITLAALLGLGWSALPAPALGAPAIRDEAGLFSAEAKRRAERTLEQIHKESGRDVVIETYNTLPGKGPDFPGNEVAEWARERARELKVNGIYLVICKKPSRFQVEEGNRTERLFSREDLREVEDILKENLKVHKFDAALEESVRYIESAIKKPSRTNSGRGVSHRGGGSGILGWVCIGLIVLMGLWVVVGLIRSARGGGSGGGGYGGGGSGGGYGGGGGGGGGFMSSLLGGMFGAAAGMWMYDSFLGHGSTPAQGADSGNTGGVQDPGQDTDYSGGGGDWGGDGGNGGGDAGGGDAGGGGGDWGGGGGGDFGGGGGDFGGGGDW